MKNLLSKIKSFLITMWKFIIADVRIAFEGPPNKNLDLPIASNKTLENRGTWSEDEVIVSIFIKKFGLDIIGLSLVTIAECLGRSKEAILRKDYRISELFEGDKSSKHSYSKLDKKVYESLNRLTEIEALYNFYRTMEDISINTNNGYEQYFSDHRKGIKGLI
jgi:hypothetical protein